MIGGLRVLAIIPARGGSKGIPRKNIRSLAGKPMLVWTVEQARASRYIDRTILSSEDDEVIRIARAAGCDVPFVRPVELAADDTPGIEPALHALRSLPGFDVAVLLQVTSPLRTPDDIDGAIEKCLAADGQSVVSVTPVPRHASMLFELGEGDRLRTPSGHSPVRTILARQLLPPMFELNGAVFLGRVSTLERDRSFLNEGTVGFVMPVERSLDIDTEGDFLLAEQALAAGASAAVVGERGK
jgi:CMP-N,N'-diacetyllegionaminic acid synthase